MKSLYVKPDNREKSLSRTLAEKSVKIGIETILIK